MMAKPAKILLQSVWENGLVVLNRDMQQTQSVIDDNLLTIFRYASTIRLVIAVILWLVITSQAAEQRLGHLLTIIDALLLTIYLFAIPLQTILKAGKAYQTTLPSRRARHGSLFLRRNQRL